MAKRFFYCVVMKLKYFVMIVIKALIKNPTDKKDTNTFPQFFADDVNMHLLCKVTVYCMTIVSFRTTHQIHHLELENLKSDNSVLHTHNYLNIELL